MVEFINSKDLSLMAYYQATPRGDDSHAYKSALKKASSTHRHVMIRS